MIDFKYGYRATKLSTKQYAVYNTQGKCICVVDTEQDAIDREENDFHNELGIIK